VVVPSGVGTAFEVRKSETCFQLPVVVLDAPPDFGQADEFFQRGRLRQGREPVVGWGRRPGGPFREEPLPNCVIRCQGTPTEESGALDIPPPTCPSGYSLRTDGAQRISPVLLVEVPQVAGLG